MRDIADTLAFIAMGIIGGLVDQERDYLRKDLTDAFEDLLNRLPEGAVPEAQRPPLGYVVLKRRTGTTYGIASRIQPARVSAEKLHENRVAELLATDPPAPEEAGLFLVAEVREVQP